MVGFFLADRESFLELAGLQWPGVQTLENRFLALGAEGDPGAVEAVRVDPHGEIELFVDEDFHYAAVEEDAQPERLVTSC
jgi:hypothetical protein